MQDKVDSTTLDPLYPKPYGMLVSEQFFGFVVPQKLRWGCNFEVFAPQNSLNWVNLGPKQLWCMQNG